jgi:hypothetical protein
MFPIAPHFFIPYSLPLSSILENLLYPAQRRRLQHIYFGTVQSLISFLVMGQSKMLNTPKKIKINKFKTKKERKAFRVPTTR